MSPATSETVTDAFVTATLAALAITFPALSLIRFAVSLSCVYASVTDPAVNAEPIVSVNALSASATVAGIPVTDDTLGAPPPVNTNESVSGVVPA